MLVKEKKYWIIGLLFLSLLIYQAPLTHAASIEQDSTKQWTITFSKPVDEQSARQHIKVIDTNGVKQPVSYQFDGNKVHISINTHYTYGKTYEVVIGNKVVDEAGSTSLVEDYGKRFKVTTLVPQLYPGTILSLGSSSNELRLEQRIDISKNKLRIYDEVADISTVQLYSNHSGSWSKVGPMFDSGNKMLHGDLLKGDGVYSFNLSRLGIDTNRAQTIDFRIEIELITGQTISTKTSLSIVSEVTEQMVVEAQDITYRVNEDIASYTANSINDALFQLQNLYQNQAGVVNVRRVNQQLRVLYANGYEQNVVIREETEQRGVASSGATNNFISKPNEVMENKVLLWSPYEYTSAPFTESEKVKELFKSSPLKFSVTHLYGAAANVESLTKLAEYNYLHFIMYNNQTANIITGQQVEPTQYLLEQSAKEIVATQLYALREGRIIPEPKLVYSVTPKWIDKNIPTYFDDNTIFYQSTNYHGELYEVLENHGLGSYIAYTNEVSSKFSSEQAVLMVASLLQRKKVEDSITIERDYLTLGAQQLLIGQKDVVFKNYERVQLNAFLRNNDFGKVMYDATLPFGWRVTGNIRTASSFANTIFPQTANGMALLIKDEYQRNEKASLQQKFYIPKKQYLRINWDFITDSNINTNHNNIEAVIVLRNINHEQHTIPLTTSNLLKSNQYAKSIIPNTYFNQQSVWHVGWQKSDYLLPANFRNQQVTITIELVNKPWTADSAILAIDAIELY